jgi:hypothetical protein
MFWCLTPLSAIKGAHDSQPCDKVYQLLVHGRWFSPASSTTTTGRLDIHVAEILLKVALSTKTSNKSFTDGSHHAAEKLTHCCILF